jgi:hypothetical protein
LRFAAQARRNGFYSLGKEWIVTARKFRAGDDS